MLLYRKMTKNEKDYNRNIGGNNMELDATTLNIIGIFYWLFIFGVPLATLGIIVYLIIKNNKKKKQKRY